MALYLVQHGKSLPKDIDPERLASCLVTGAIDKKVFKFQNGGIVCLDRESVSEDWFIKWALMPTIK